MPKQFFNVPKTVLVVAALTMPLLACSDPIDESTVSNNSTSSGSVSSSSVVDADTEQATVSATDSYYLDSYTIDDSEYGTSVSVVVDGGTRSIETNSLPDHDTGEFPNSGNPNTISAQELSYEYPVVPTWTGEAQFARAPGVAVNGIAFEPGTAETVTCASGEQFRIEALQEVYDLGFDVNNAHVQPTGKYHYHGISEVMADAYTLDDDLVHVGFAADGYLMYYSKSGKYDSSYALGTEPRSGTECVVSGPGARSADIDGSTPDGAYTSDWVFTEGSGDLDSCNGTTIDGTYAYIITTEFPFVSRCLNGEFTQTRPGEGGGAGAGQGAGTQGSPPDLTAAAAALGITEQELTNALGPPPPDLQAAAETLGITVDELQSALGR